MRRQGEARATSGRAETQFQMTQTRVAVVALVEARHGASDLEAFAEAVEKLVASRPGVLGWYWVDGGALPAVRSWLQSRPGDTVDPAGRQLQGASLAEALKACRVDWLWCVDPADARVAALLPGLLAESLRGPGSLRPLRPFTAGPESPGWPGTWRDWIFGIEALASAGPIGARSGLPLAAQPLDWAADALLWQLLLQQDGPDSDATEPEAGGWQPRPVPEPARSHWQRPEVYGAALEQLIVAALEAARPEAMPPRWMQRAALAHLAWFFEVDRRERAPTVALAADDAPAFHALLARALGRIEPEVLWQASPGFCSSEVYHALRAYHGGRACTPATLDAYDHRLGLGRLRYDIHGEPPDEVWRLDGVPTAPRFAKYRACVFFHRRLFRQRIAWVEAPAGAVAELQLGGERVPVHLGPPTAGLPAQPPPEAAALCALAAKTLDDRKGGQRPLPPGTAGWRVRARVRALAMLAGLPWVRRRYRDAWVFADRGDGAGDSAEHLYRWLRAHHPEINAWYFLRPDSPDWGRLARDGFRLVPPGMSLKLLALNCRHLISSHTGHEFGMDRALYGDRMRFRYTFLQHGVTYNDVSHWLNPCRFDRVITSSPQEHAAFVGDDTPYTYTAREVRRTGFPRHDGLLRLAAEAEAQGTANWVLVMPTWRANLVGQRTPEVERLARFHDSDYARAWRGVLNDRDLHEHLSQAGLRLVFMPHANAAPFLSAFEVPPDVPVVHMVDDQVRQALARARIFVTDFTSAAFEAALLRRAIVYYQFDRDAFYRGAHNLRPGYFDYARDGFGPVATDAAGLKQCLLELAARGGRPDECYLQRMAAAMPDRDGQACQRTYDSIVELG